MDFARFQFLISCLYLITCLHAGPLTKAKGGNGMKRPGLKGISWLVWTVFLFSPLFFRAECGVGGGKSTVITSLVLKDCLWF